MQSTDEYGHNLVGDFLSTEYSFEEMSRSLETVPCLTPIDEREVHQEQLSSASSRHRLERGQTFTSSEYM